MEDQLTLDQLFADPYEDAPIVEQTDDDAPQDPPSTTTPDPDEDKDAEVRKAYFDYLVSNEIIVVPQDFEYDGSEEKLEQAKAISQQELYKQHLTSFVESLPEDYKAALQAAAQGIPLSEYYSANYQDPATLDLASEDAQRKVVERFLKETTQFPQNKIERLIKAYEEEGTLLQEAQDAASELQTRYEQRQEQLKLQREQEQAQQEAARQKYTNDLVQAIETTPFIHPSRRQKVRSFFFSPIRSGETQTTAFNLTIQNILANPQHQAQLADILLDYSSQDGFSLERFERRVKNKSTSLLREDIDRALAPKSKGAPPAPLKKDSSEFLEN